MHSQYIKTLLVSFCNSSQHLMKRLFTSFIIISLVLVTACNAEQEKGNNNNTSGGSAEENVEIVLKEKPKVIEDLFLDISEAFSIEAIQQNTAFAWKKGNTSQLFDGFRLKAEDSKADAATVSEFFTKDFEIDESNTKEDESGWSQGYRNENLLCLIQGMNGNQDAGTRDLIINCAETDQQV
jgi:hypothetical protein